MSSAIFLPLQTVMGRPEIKVPLFQSTEAQPHNGDIQKSQALLSSQIFFISNLGIVGARAFLSFRLSGDLAFEDIFKDIKQSWSCIYENPVMKLEVKLNKVDVVSLYYSQAINEFILVS